MKHLFFREELPFHGFIEAKLDSTFQQLPPNKNGFYALGVSAGIVFVIFHQNQLITMEHWGNIPDSRSSEGLCRIEVQEKLDSIQSRLLDLGYPPSKCKVYAFGGQPSSANTVGALRALVQEGNSELKINLKGIDLIENDEDTFDLRVSRDAPNFEVKIDRADPALMESPVVLNAYGCTVNRERIVETEKPKSKRRNTLK